MRTDGWPTTRADGPLTNHSNGYLGFSRTNNFGDAFLPLDSREGRWLDGEALARVRDRSKSPISYHDAVIEAQNADFRGPSDLFWKAITYAEVHERNERADEETRDAGDLADELGQLLVLDTDNGIEFVNLGQLGDHEADFQVEYDGRSYRVSFDLIGESS